MPDLTANARVSVKNGRDERLRIALIKALSTRGAVIEHALANWRHTRTVNDILKCVTTRNKARVTRIIGT